MYSRAYKASVMIPPVLWVTAFLLVPYSMLFGYSFWSVSPSGMIVHSWNLQNYVELARNPIYVTVLLRSMRIAGSVTLLALLLGYPLAYYLSFYALKRKELLYQLVIIPLCASYLVREHVLPNLSEASHDLGASPSKTFRRVVLPLSLPGVLAGATFAFVLTLGDFLAPLLVGGPSGIMISNVVVSLFGAAYNWPLGAAISFCMMLLVVTLLFITERLEKRLAVS